MAAGIVVGLTQLLITLIQVSGNVQLQLRRVGSFLCGYLAVDDLCNMQNGIVVRGVGIVPMPEPVGGFQMQFDIAGPKGSANLQFSIEEVGSLVGVVHAGVYNFNFAPVCCKERL